MSGPNGDPNISIDDGIINDEDEFEDEGNLQACSFIGIDASNVIAVNGEIDLMSCDTDFELVWQVQRISD